MTRGNIGEHVSLPLHGDIGPRYAYASAVWMSFFHDATCCVDECLFAHYGLLRSRCPGSSVVNMLLQACQMEMEQDSIQDRVNYIV